MSDILRLLFGISLLTIGLSAYFLVLSALFTARLTRTKSIARSMPARSFGIGFVNFVFFGVIALMLFSMAENAGTIIRGILTIPATLIVAGLAILLSTGLAGMANLVGEHLFADASASKQMLWGTVCLTLACALPFVGWLLLAPYVGFIGIGAVILGFFRRDVC